MNDSSLVTIGAVAIVFACRLILLPKKTTIINSEQKNKTITDITKIDFVNEKMLAMKSVMQERFSEFKCPPDWEDRKWYIKNRDGNKCTQCGGQFRLHVHHKMPVNRHPNHSESNLVTLCIECHSKQGGLGHHNLISMDYKRAENERLEKYNFKHVKPRKDYSCDICNEIICRGTASYTKDVWSNNNVNHNINTFPDYKMRLCISCFWDYPYSKNRLTRR